MSIGARIRQLRTENKLSQEKFGEFCGVTKGMVSQWESDRVTPSTEKLLELRKHLSFSFDWILNGFTGYATNDPKLVVVCKALETHAEYVKDAAVTAVLSTCELAERATSTGKTKSESA